MVVRLQRTVLGPLSQHRDPKHRLRTRTWAQCGYSMTNSETGVQVYVKTW